MKKLEMSINTGIGDNIIVRVFFDVIKHNYDQIIVSHNKDVIEFSNNGDPNYLNFLNELGNTLFTTPPYIFSNVQYKPLFLYDTIKELNILPSKPNLDSVLCAGTSLNLGEEYIVITTKIRGLRRKDFYPFSINLWKILRKLSEKYKIVILGERQVENNKEYANISDIVYSIYEQIITNLPSHRIVDLTVPSLGVTTPDLKKIKQDCLIMKESKCIVTLAIGGNLWLALSVANVIGFKYDCGIVNNYINDMVSCLTNPKFSTAFITYDWHQFIKKIGSI